MVISDTTKWIAIIIGLIIVGIIIYYFYKYISTTKTVVL